MSRLFPIIALVVTLCVVAGAKIVRSSCGSLMREGLRLNVDLNDPALQMLGLVAAIAIGVVIPLWITNWQKRRKEKCSDFTRTFDRREDPTHSVSMVQEAPIPDGVMLVPDAAVFEVAEIAELFEQRGIRFETRQTVIDNAFHWIFGNGGLGTRMCIIVYPDDVARAQSIVDRVLNPPSPDMVLKGA